MVKLKLFNQLRLQNILAIKSLTILYSPIRAAEAWGGKGGSALPPLYMGLIIPAVRFLLNPLKDGLVVGWTGRDFGAGPRLKLVVLPLNALMFRENFAEGCSEAKDASLEFGFKLIL